ncbi:alcohol dehydrogenase catalytic domain-containing protein [Streptosporangium sp. NPDC048865]|uniref:alcohol dehydrogenase catalytic domain-containing protein n=1 Tax=Streptosporangium sp. NPDC048865 TaxID=3155766 RepID=UPI003427BEF3
MRAVVFDAFGAVPEVREVPAPEPPPGGAVIRVEATGLCRSDWHGWQGHDPDIRVLPHVPGHELAGVVEVVGPGVSSWRAGDRVTVPFVCACGSCAACLAGDHQVCEHQTQPGFTRWGSFAEYVAVDHADVNLVRLPEEMSFGTAASLGCRFATSYRAVTAVGRVRPDEWVAVHGCGGVGLSAVMIAAAAGAQVVAVDVSAGALELARRFGAVACVGAGTSGAEVAARVREATSGGAHVSIDALGSPGTCVASIESLRRRGRHVQIGLLPGLTSLPMGRVIGYELELLGSHGMAAHAYPAMLEAVAGGALRPDALVTRTIGLEEAGAALASIGSVPGVTMILPSRR